MMVPTLIGAPLGLAALLPALLAPLAELGAADEAAALLAPLAELDAADEVAATLPLLLAPLAELAVFDELQAPNTTATAAAPAIQVALLRARRTHPLLSMTTAML
jgi:hypothetical protein